MDFSPDTPDDVNSHGESGNVVLARIGAAGDWTLTWQVDSFSLEGEAKLRSQELSFLSCLYPLSGFFY